MRVLVTGHLGYVGSVMTTVLQNSRFDVVGLDCDLFRACDFGRVRDSVPYFAADLRDIEFTDLLSFDAVIHLAALSGDMSRAIDGSAIEQINRETTMRLAECCKKASVSRFLFASSCSVYGRGGCELLNENSPVQPLTPYAKSKLASEHDLTSIADSGFMPLFLRSGTVYGVSPRMRLDLVVNDFVASAVTTGHIAMQTAGTAWRPLVHVEDVARAYAAVLRDPGFGNNCTVFNVVPPGENYHVVDIADAVTEMVPHIARSAANNTYDERSYRVSGARLPKTLSHFRYRWNLRRGIEQLCSALTNAGLTAGDWRSDRYRRSLRLKYLLESGAMSRELRWSTPAAVA